MHIRDAQKEAWDIAEEKGFHFGRDGGRDDTLLRLCLVHTEVSEAAQLVKRHWKGAPTENQVGDFEEELADAVIRILDLAETVGADMEGAIAYKMHFNRSRPKNYNTAMEVA